MALVGLTMTAGAADLPRRTVAPPMVAPIMTVPVFTWTGFYVGVNAGYGFADSGNNQSTYFLPGGSVLNSPTTAGTLTINSGRRGNEEEGFVGGAQIGYNVQFGAFVAGIEADLQYADLGGSRNDRFAPATGSYTFVGTPGLAFAPPSATVIDNGVGGVEWFGTVRARLGFAFDRVLVYGTGGLAYGSVDNGNFTNVFSSNNDDVQFGYALGGGVEYAFTNNLTFKLEGLYVNLGNGDRNSNQAVFNVPTNELFLNNRGGDIDFGVVRVGLNYKF